VPEMVRESPVIVHIVFVGLGSLIVGPETPPNTQGCVVVGLVIGGGGAGFSGPTIMT
jgi:hypothetical protein